MSHKAGYINILGKPNVGKSTLTNAIVGERVSIVTSKAQTTRHRILGIVNGDDYQLIFSDLPGIIKPAYKMQESMMDFVRTSFDDADVFIYVAEIGDQPENQPEEYEKIKQMDVPVLLLLNKIDLAMQEEIEEQLAVWIANFPKAKVLPLSALDGLNREVLIDQIVELLPESPPYFDKEEWTDKPERFFVTEVIREKILRNYKQEIPYSCEVVCTQFKEEETIIRISADIYVERESQKPILIGKGGDMLKRVGTQARTDLERFFAKKIFLETHVRVADNWRNNENMLRKFGYKE
ncbi:MAG: GTPase Era [Chitinophagales bacterium]